MNFPNWYKVIVEKDASGNNIKFSDFNGTSGDNGNEFRNNASLDVHNFTTEKTANGVTTEGLLDMGYYGVSGPEEVTGVVRFKETSIENNVQYEREFRAGYGMKPITE